MGCRNVTPLSVHALLAMVLSLTLGGALNESKDECERTAPMRIYSNASFIKEAGDVVGYELAVQQRQGALIDAFLYVYEGVRNKDGFLFQAESLTEDWR